MSMKSRLPFLLEMRKQHLETLRRNFAAPGKDCAGVATSSLLNTLRFIGVAEFITTGVVASFRRSLCEAARLGLSLLDRAAGGDPIDVSYLSMLRYTDILNALAGGDYLVAQRVALKIGGRPAIEKEHNDVFDECFGYALKYCVLDEHDLSLEWIAQLRAVCAASAYDPLHGCVICLDAILNRSASEMQIALQTLNRDHNRLIEPGAIFNGLEDEVVCVWGVGLANLARYKGLAIHGEPPFIPIELLVPTLTAPVA